MAFKFYCPVCGHSEYISGSQPRICTSCGCTGSIYEELTMSNLSKYHDTPACQCEHCRLYCQRPCWPTPVEANRLLDEGYADRLMLDWWARDGFTVPVLCGALKGSEAKIAPRYPASEAGCTFWVNGLCQLHDKGLKPLLGRYSDHTRTHEQVEEVSAAIAAAWNTDEGIAVVERWREIVGNHEPLAGGNTVFDEPDYK